jgi:uncharacterized membrane protein (DUF485 family)
MKKSANPYIVTNGIMFILVWFMVIGLTGFDMLNPLTLKLGIVISFLSIIVTSFIMWDFNQNTANYQKRLANRDKMVAVIVSNLESETRDQLLARIVKTIENAPLNNIESLYNSWTKPQKIPIDNSNKNS